MNISCSCPGCGGGLIHLKGDLCESEPLFAEQLHFFQCSQCEALCQVNLTWLSGTTKRYEQQATIAARLDELNKRITSEVNEVSRGLNKLDEQTHGHVVLLAGLERCWADTSLRISRLRNTYTARLKESTERITELERLLAEL